MSESELDEADLQAIIEDHASRQRYFGKMDDPDVAAFGYNPVCGDRYQIFLRLTDECIVEVQFTGYGCVISRASASMMTEVLRNLSRSEAERLIKDVENALEHGASLPAGLLPDLVALLGVRRFPSRIKCVTLPWHAARAALAGESMVSTE